jgi:hypothetical protein
MKPAACRAEALKPLRRPAAVPARSLPQPLPLAHAPSRRGRVGTRLRGRDGYACGACKARSAPPPRAAVRLHRADSAAAANTASMRRLSLGARLLRPCGHAPANWTSPSARSSMHWPVSDKARTSRYRPSQDYAPTPLGLRAESLLCFRARRCTRRRRVRRVGRRHGLVLSCRVAGVRSPVHIKPTHAQRRWLTKKKRQLLLAWSPDLTALGLV